MVPKSLRASSTIIAIDTDKLDPNKTFDVSNGIDPKQVNLLKIQHINLQLKMLRF